jgi:hypothetical protein
MAVPAAAACGDSCRCFASMPNLSSHESGRFDAAPPARDPPPKALVDAVPSDDAPRSVARRSGAIRYVAYGPISSVFDPSALQYSKRYLLQIVTHVFRIISENPDFKLSLTKEANYPLR